MKNTYILPTDKPSKLHEFGNIWFNHKEPTECFRNYNIYITSDEEITGLENNIWVYNNGRVWLWENTMALRSNNKPKKIILTTDQDLFKDDVQAINDEFHDWFVKNPNCERVEVELKTKHLVKPYDVYNEQISYYKINIPQEEAKFISGQPFLEKADEVIVIHRPKQETLEKAAHKILINYGIKSIGQSIGVLEVKKLMVNFAKWQQEQDKNNYSEEDMKQSFEAGKKGYMRGSYLTQEYYFTWNNFKLWFEQFKKK
jgi:hypothetical protein